MSTLSSQIANLSPEQLAKLAYELKASKASKQQEVRRHVPGEPCPLSFAQQRLWFIAQLEPGNPTYNCLDALRLTGKLNIPLLNQTLNEVVRRHEALRTTFELVGDEPMQIVSQEIKLNSTVIDLRPLPESERERQVSKLSSEELRRPFDLTRGPLLRVVVLRVSEHEHAIVFTTHHIVSDGWSRDILVRQIIAIYLAFAEGSPSPLPELSFQYADFAISQRQRLTGPVLEKHLDYWKRHLANAPHVLSLPTDRPRPAIPTRRGAYETVTLSPDLSHSLRALGRGQGVTLFMTMLAAFDVLLSRYSGQTDFLIGTDIANRNHGTTESLIGFFVNQLVLRVDLAGDPSFNELLERVKEVTLNGYAHQEAPFEKVVEMLNPERNLSHAPLFQVKLLLENASTNNLELPELAIGGVEADGLVAKFDLTLVIYEGDQISAVMEYATDLFESSTIERMLGHYEELLHSIVREPQQRVSRLALLSSEARQQLVREWNETAAPYETDVTLGTLFERQVARDATAVAVVSGDEELTYGELNEQANRVARYLQGLGIGAESRVGLLVERSLEMVVGLLGIVKAGAAYVPLDPGYPAERLRYMVTDAGVELVLVGETGSAEVWEGVSVVKLSECQTEVSEDAAANVQRGVSGKNVAYVIYTSGSTGQPKGVMVTHDNVTRLFAAVQAEFQFNQQDVWTMFHSYAFDFSVWELWGALLYGGRLVVVPYLVSRSPGEFWQLLAAEGVTVLSQTPSAFSALMRVAAEAGGNEQLRAVVFGGEALDYASLRGWVSERGVERTALVNMYGITETTVHVTYHRISEQEVEEARGSLIGKPIGDLQCYILDEWQEPVPVGVSGEIYVGGAGLARGYLGNPGLTAERFVPNPYSEEPGARLYKTGDLARHGPEGNLEYAGRRDTQEKIRGFRIEPGEIESVLGRHASVKECAVVIRREANGEKRLVAYVVDGNDEPRVNTSGLREYLRERLPEFMLPSAIVPLESMPLTTNGKVDRRELAAREVRVVSSGRSYVPPRTTTEELISGVWTEVLGAERVGIHDNFFELGGDSILTIQVIVKARAVGFELNVQQLFRYQTVHELAQELERSSESYIALEETAPFSLISEEDRLRLPAGVVDAYPLTALQAGMLFHSELAPEAGQYQDIFSFHLRLPFDEEALRATLQQLIDLHPVLRTSFNLSDFSEPLQLVHEEVAVPLRIGDLRGLSETKQEAFVAEWVAAKEQHRFEWRHAPLLRFQIDRRSEESFQFSFSCHHAILDGWSVATMLTELFNVYGSVIHGDERETKAPLGTSFRDFVAAEQAVLNSEEARQYWTTTLSGATQTRLPRLIEAGPMRMAARGVELSAELFEGLKQMARRAGVPLKSVVLAAHLRVLSLLSGSDDVLTGVVSHGRTETKDSERVLGLFLNTLPFRQKLSGGTWLDLVQATFASERELLPFRRYPLARMQQDLGNDVPLFETVFNFTHFHVHNEMQNVGGLEVLSQHSVADTNFMFGVDFSIDLEGSRIAMELQCDVGQWSESQLEAATRYYLTTLEEMARTPLARYEHQSLLSNDERRTILHEWNEPAPELYSDCYHRLFEAQVARTPGALAALLDTEQLTYEELNSRANQLAHYLQTLGIGPEVPVGILLERSLDSIVTLLAILKAGGVFIPLDEQQPAERQQYIVDDARIAALLTHTRFKEVLPKAVPVVYVDLEQEKIGAQSTANLTGVAHPANLAYVMYTSGSTGRPKGVAVSHEGILSHCLDIQEQYELRAGDRMLVFGALTFDLSLEEILPPLLFGASLVMRGGPVWTPSEFVRALAKYEISIFMLATAYWHKLTQESIDELTSSFNVRLVALGGEAALPETVRRWQSTPMRDVPLINTYGPTETIISATSLAVVAPWPDTSHLPTVPIGRPLTRRTAYILDAHGNPAPVGVPGELHIGGPVIARGYVHQPELTAEKFIPDMFSDQPGGRLYRTGDLARYLPDGNIEFLGRVDHQVKIRGFRVELGEIEAALKQHASVKEAVVLYENERLIAYAQLRMEGEVGARDLRAYLKERLPEYMASVVFMEMAEFPLTPNGKINRRALPAVETISVQDAEYEAPRTPVEELLSGLWANVLRVDRVGINDNFFELGGHSLLAIQLISRIRDAFGLELPLIDLFEHRTISELAQSVENRMRAGHDLLTAPLSPAPRDEALPLSFAQQRLWFLDQLVPESAAYNMGDALRLYGELNIGALKQSINEIMRRHEAIRTTFPNVDGDPRQVITPFRHVHLPLIDLSSLPDVEREAEVARIASAEGQRPFDLQSGPLLRATLLLLRPEDHVLLFSMHHIVSDGWSNGILAKEVTALYDAFTTGDASPLPELAIQYGDFAVWQRQWLSGDVLARQLDYWTSKLQGVPPLLALPTDYQRPKVQVTEGAFSTHVVSPELTAELKSLAQQSEATLYMTMLAAFHALLHRYAHQATIVTGSPVANRTRVETEPLIGFFVNTLVLRSDFDDDPTFLTHLTRLRKHALEAYAHQDLPFEMLVDELQLARDLSYNPLFQVMFTWEEASLDQLTLRGLELGTVGVANETSQVDLTLHVTEFESGHLSCGMQYSTALFTEETIERMLGHYEELLHSIVREPQQRVSRLALLNSEARQQLLRKWNETAEPYETGVTLGSLFERQVARDATAVAVVSGDEKLTYGELNEQANRVARYLQGLGIGAESRVGLLVERSLEMVVGLLGIVKAGAAYVPLDPGYPAERLRYMVADAGVELVLVGETSSAEVWEGVSVVKLSECQTEVSEEAAANVQVSGKNVAYVIYTSGSTGQPKGVMVTHDNVTRLFAAVQAEFQFNERDVWTMFHSYAFDFSVWELWGALLYGGRLVVVPYLVSRSPGEFWQLLAAEGVTVLSQTPSAFSALMRVAAEAGGNEQLRAVVFGGEALDYASLRGWVSERGVERPALVNMYGITETTVHVTYHRISEQEVQEARGSLIGKPIGDLQCYILDEWQEPTPVGVSGEIYVGGAGLARGYLGNPGLTAERFVPNPYSEEPGARLYKTGDLARHMTDGDLEYAGRIDQQVKLRGFRIELGEIESVLKQHASVKEAILVMQETEQRLVAYVQLLETTAVGELRAYLKERLPEYMVPASFVVLAEFPLTSSGKIDRRALPAPESFAEVEYQAPRTETEELLTDLWANVLRAPRVGVHDNFFDLGGDSILTIQVIAKAHALGLELNVQQLFQYQTVHELAQELERSSESYIALEETAPFSLISEEDRIRLPAGVVDAYPLTALQAGMLFHSELDPDAGIYHFIFSFHLRLPFDAEALRATLQQLIDLHPVLRTSFNLSDFSEPLQLVHEEVAVPLRIGEVRGLSESEQEAFVAEWVAAEKQQRFDWSHAPLLRFQIDRRSEESFQFSLSFHHAILDGWSLATMLAELFNLYSVMQTDGRVSAAPVSAPFRDFVAAEQAILNSEEARGYWSSMLSDSTQTRLPRLGQSAGPSGVATRNIALPSELSAGLKQLARTAGVPLKSVLLAAHLRALNVLTGSHDVLTGIVSHGRPETIDSERALGLFLNTLPFRRRLAGGTWLQLVQETFAAERELLPFRRYPLARMQQDLGNDAPLFEVIFNFVHFHVSEELQTVNGLEVLGSDGSGYTNFTLAIDFSLEQGLNLALELQYDTAELSAEQIEAMGRAYLTILESMTRSPLERYEHQCLLSPEERQRILYDWNDTATPELDNECYLHLFEAQVARTPNALAAVLGAEQLTYDELNRRANQLAHYLQTVGVGAEVPVGVLLERSLEMIVALLAIFKAGGAYVPLDPEYPDERLRFMVRDAGLEFVVTQEKLSSRLADTVVQSIRIDADWPEIANENQDDLPLLATAPNLAYIIYTSGSSGTPKGAMVTHGGMVNCLQWMQQRYELTEQDGFLMHTSLNFDPSVWEVFWPLMVGGRVVVAPSKGMLDSSALRYMAEQKVRCAYFVPSLLGVLVKEPRLKDVSSLRYVISGGEKLPLGVMREFQELSRAELHHSYGPTETAIAATEWTCVAGAERVLMGRPIGNTQVYVLDQQMEPLPVGVAGELYIGGAGVGRGYAGQAELTAESFVPDRFSAKVGARLYRTGDMVRYDQDGNLEFLGRVDEQVKLRGYRIELGEIEAVLRRHEQVRAAVVVLSEEDEDGDKRLVAYVVGDVQASELRAYLKAQLPNYMVPSFFVVLNELPLLPNGKINRRALPSPYQSTTSDSLTTPRDVLELQLAQIWKEELGREQIGLRDNFFDLGGHSLVALRLISKVERLAGQKIPVSILFRGATIEQLAATLRQHKGTVREQSLVPIQPDGSRPPLFLVHPASGNVMSYVALARRLGREQPVYGLQSKGLDPERKPTTHVEDMASEYLQELTAVQPDGPYHLGGWSMGGVIAFEMARQLTAAGKSLASVVLIDSVIQTGRLETNGWDDTSLLLALAQHHGLFLDDHMFEELRSLSLDEQLELFLEKGADYDQFPRDIGVPHLRHLFELFKANVHAAESYRAATSEQKVILLQAADAPPDHAAETLRRWKKVADVVAAHPLSGDHYSIVTEPNVTYLAEQIKSILPA
jgi:amino acid adenylation domain-containing protein